MRFVLVIRFSRNSCGMIKFGPYQNIAQSMESYLDLTRLTLGLGDDWKIDKVLLDEQIQQIDIYVSHSGGALVCPETGEPGTLYDHRKVRT